MKLFFLFAYSTFILYASLFYAQLDTQPYDLWLKYSTVFDSRLFSVFSSEDALANAHSFASNRFRAAEALTYLCVGYGDGNDISEFFSLL